MKKSFLIVIFCCLQLAASAITYYNKSTGTGALQTLSNWGQNTDGTGTPPGSFTSAGDVFNLYNGSTATISAAWVITGVTLNVGNGSAAMNLTIPSTFSLTGTGTVAVSAGSTLTLQNTTNPTLGTLNATSTVDYNGTGAQTIALATYGNLSLSGARAATPAITLASGTINVSGNFSVTYTGSVTFTTTGNTFTYSNLTGGSTVGGITYNILKFSNTSGTNTAAGNISVGSTMTTTAGGTIDMSTFTLSVTGTITNGGTIQTESLSATPLPTGKSLTGTVIYGALTGGQTIVSETYYTNLKLNNTSGTNTVSGTIPIRTGGTLTTTAGGTMDFTAAFRLTQSGGGGKPTITNNGTIKTSVPTATSATPFISGLTWGGTGTVLYAAAAGSQTVMAGTYNCNLNLGNTSGTNTASGVITENGTLTTTSGGTLSMSTSALAGTGTFTNNGTISTTSTTNPAIPSGKTWTGTTGAVIFAATAGLQSIPTGTYGTLKVSNTSATNNAVGTVTVNSSLITTSGGTLAMGTNQLLGAFTPTNNGTITTTCTSNPAIPAGQSWSGTTGAITFALTTGGQFVPSGTYKTLTFSNTSGTNTAVGNIVVNTGTMTTTAGGTLDMTTAYTLSGTGTFTNNGTIKTSVPTSTSAAPIPAGLTWAGTIIYSAAGGAQTVVNGTYNNLTLSNTSSTNTAGGNIVVNVGTLTTTAGGTLDMGTTALLSGTGIFTNNGTIQTSVPTSLSATPIPSGKAWAGTIIYGASAGLQTVVSETSYNNLTLNNTSGINTSAANLVVNGNLATTSGGTLDLGAFTLSGTLASTSGSGIIETANTSATPISSGITWAPTIVYYKSTGGQTIVSGTYSGGLTNSNISSTNTVVAAGTVTIPGNLTLSANSSLNDNGVTISLGGNILGTGTHTGSGAISMTTSGATISGATLANLTLNNAGGFSLTGNPTINGTLTFNNGTLNIGTNNLIFGTAAPAVAGTLSSSKMIIANGGGQVQKLLSGTGSFLFPVGDNSSNYSPITLNFTGGSFAGGAYAGIKVTNAKHPQNANTTNYLNRYWSIATSGITSPAYQVTAASYPAGNFAGTESGMAVGAYPTSLPWVKVTGSSVNTSTHTLSATGTLNYTAVDITGINATGPSVTITSPSASICTGSTAVLTANPTGDPTFMYSWAPSTGLSSTSGVSVNASPTTTGTVSTVYVYTVTATDGNGFSNTGTFTLTVNPVPVVTGTTTVCLASTTTLSSNIAGTWTSSNGSVASVGSATGVVTGAALGNANITITPVSGCTSSASVTVNAVPSAISGASSICAGSSTTLTESVSGGVWSSSNNTIATVGTSGIVTGVAGGSATISYISGAACYVTQPLTVGPISSITGTLNVCVGGTTNLADASGGGTWSSSNPSAGTVGTASGVVTGIAPGTTDITYSLGTGCTRTATITVNAVPSAITGTFSVCQGLTTTLTESVSGGAWSSSDITTASVGTSGVVTGVAAGTATISYISGPGCNVTATVTVNPLPAVITGTMTVCAGLTTSLGDATGSGTWTSSNANATIGSSSGIATGVTAGNSTITYTLPTGCINTAILTINALPAAITGTLNACAGLTSTVADGTAGGTWSSSNNSFATVGSSTGVVSGVASGTPYITYTLTATGCIATTPFTVNPLPSAISGASSVCQGLTTTLTDAGGGTWASNNSNATIGSSTGVVTGSAAGTSTITYTLSTGCLTTAPITVNPLPAAITGNTPVCVGQTITLNDATVGGTWSSSNTSLATFGTSTGILFGVSSGNPVISYSLPTGCIATVIATVNPLPASITGIFSLCNGNSTTLSDATGGGTWSSSDVTNATIGSATGNLVSLSSGTAVITYQLPTSCITTATVTVNDIPSAITGTTEICIGQTTTLSDPDGGGTWSSSDNSIATVGTASGLVTSVAAGSATITYTFTATGCYNDAGILIDPLPAAITGNLIVCVGSVTNLDNTATGGDWTSSNTAVGTVDIVTGDVTALTPGTTTITYTLPTGCSVSSIVTVTAMPTLVNATNNGPICASGTLNLNANSPSHVTAYSWSGPVSITSSTSAAASVPAATLSAGGTYTVTVSNGSGVGCSNTYTTSATVNATPTAAPVNSGPICNTGTVTLTANPGGSTTNYTWSGSNLSSTTVANPTSTPTATATYSLTVTNGTAGPGCSSTYTTTVSVSATPTAGIANSGPICSSGTVTLVCNPAGSTNTFAWSGPNLASSTVQSPTATPTTTATYSLTVTNGTANPGCSSSYTTTVTVAAQPTAGPTNNGPICSSGTVALTANPAGSTTTYLWSGSGLSSTTIANPSATATTTTTYSLTVTNGTANSGCSSSYTTTVSVNATPTAGPTNSGPICNTGTVTLTANPGGSTNTYVWSGSNLSSTTAQNPTATPTATATYSLTVTNGTANPGCSSSYTTTVTVNATPTAGPTNSGPICNSGTVTLTANPGGSTNTYTWSGSNLSSTTAQNPTATPTATATYSLTVTNGTAGSGCSSNYTTTVSVNATPTAGPTNNGPICHSGTVTLSANPGGSTNTYSWSGPNLSSTTAQNPTATPNITSTYSLTVSNGTAGSGCSNNYTTTVSVNAVPSASPTNSGPICNGGTVTLSANPAGSTSTYSWSGPDLLSTTTQNPTATPTATATYSLTVTNGTLGSGCSNSYTTTATVTPAVTASPSNSGPICAGGTVNLNANPGGAASTYLWSGSSLSSSTTAATSATPGSSEIYSVTVSDGTSNPGCVLNLTTAVSVNPTPTAAPTNSGPVCFGSTVYLSADPTGGVTSYSWTGPFLSSTTAQNPSAVPTVTSTYSLTVSSGSASGCSPATVYTTTVTVNSLPAIITIGNSGPVCANNTLNLTSTASGGSGTFNYSWSGPAAFTSTLQNPSISSVTTAASGTYTLSVTDGSSCAATGSNTTSVTIYPAPAITSISNSSPFCTGTATLNITSAASGGTGSLNYSWAGPSAFSSTLQNPSISAATTAASGIYTLTVTDAHSCTATGTNTTTVSVNPFPAVAPITGASGVCKGSSVSLSDATGGGVWSSGSALATIGSGTGVVTGVNLGSVTITYTVTNGFSCSTPVYFPFTVEGAPHYFYTVAGTGANSSTGDGGLAAAATFQSPRALATDTTGNIYIADLFANTIRMISVDGYVTGVAGNGSTGNTGDGGPATAATLNMSGGGGLYVDKAGNILISNTTGQTIRKVNASTRIITTIAGTAATSGFSGDGGPASAARVFNPIGLCEDISGNIYFADASNYRIRRIDAGTGFISTIIGTGSNAYSGDGGLGISARVSIPRDVMADNYGNLYIADYGNNRIRKYVIATGVITTFAGTGTAGSSGDGGPATAAQLYNPTRLSFDGGNILYIADQGNNKIRQINLTTGIISTVIATGTAGFSGDGGPATSAKISLPGGVAINKYGHLFVSDANNHRIRVSPYNGTIMITTDTISVPAGTPITFTANTSLVNDLSYQWKLNGSNISGATDNTYTDPSATNGNIYTCVLTITPDCSAGYSVTSNTITISTYGPPPFPSGVVAPAIANGLAYYPNPVHNILSISGDNFADGYATIDIFDQLARKVISESVIVSDGKLRKQIDLQSLPAGLYIINVTDSDSKIGILKCIKN